MKRLLLLILLTISFLQFFFFTSSALAASDFFIPSNYVPVATKNLPQGTILSTTLREYTPCASPYDPNIIGVITATPAIKQEIESTIPYYPLTTSGQNIILVTTKNGKIKKGDFLTCSGIPGVAMKAKHSGVVIGTAQEDYAHSTVGTIDISIDIHFAYIPENNVLLDTFNYLKLRADMTENATLVTIKYILSFIIASLTIFFTFTLISKTANRGIDALGRNPLSSRQITLGISLNILIATLLLITGSCISFIIFKL